MATKDVFNGATAGLRVFYAYTNTVAQDIGMERALGLLTKMAENGGAMRGKAMKEKAGTKKLDAKTAWLLLRTVPESMGESIKVVEQSPQRVAFRVITCPHYEAAQMLGMDAKTIETICRASSTRLMDVCAKQLDPGLSFRARKFRSAADDFCEEEITLG
jgi:hypothetical protein